MSKKEKSIEALEAAWQLMDWAESKCHTNCFDGYIPMMPHGDFEPCQWCITRNLIEQVLKKKQEGDCNGQERND